MSPALFPLKHFSTYRHAQAYTYARGRYINSIIHPWQEEKNASARAIKAKSSFLTQRTYTCAEQTKTSTQKTTKAKTKTALNIHAPRPLTCSTLDPSASSSPPVGLEKRRVASSTPEARASVISPSASRIQKFPFRGRDDGQQREDLSELSSGSANLRLVQAFEVGDYRSGCCMRWTALFTVGSRCLSKRDVHKLVGASVDVLVPAASSAGAPCFSIALHSHWTTPIPALPAPHTTNLRMRERGEREHEAQGVLGNKPVQ